MITPETATTYVLDYMQDAGVSIAVVRVEFNAECYEPAYDVFFSARWDHNESVTEECMTVWAQSDGSLYGEW